MLIKFGNFVMRSRMHAALTALIISFVPLFGWIGVVIMGLVTLRRGAKEGLFVLMWVMIPDIVNAMLGHPQVLLYDVLGGSVFIWMVAIVLRKTASWTQVIQFSALFGVGFVLVVHGYATNVDQFWHKYLMELFKFNSSQLPPAEQQALANMVTQLKQQGVIDFVAKIATGVVAGMTLLFSLVNLFLARWWQAVLYNPDGLGKELVEIKLGYESAAVFLLCILAVLANVRVAWDILPLFMLAYILACISMVHGLAAMTKNGLLSIIICYAVLVLFSPYSLFIFAVTAFADSLLDFRKRLRTKLGHNVD